MNCKSKSTYFTVFAAQTRCIVIHLTFFQCFWTVGSQLELQPPRLLPLLLSFDRHARSPRGCIYPARFREVVAPVLKGEPASMGPGPGPPHRNMQLHTAEPLTEQTVHARIYAA